MPALEITNFNIIVSLLGGWIAAFGLVSYLSKENLYLSEALISLLAGVAFSPVGANFIRPLEYAGSSKDVEAITLNFARLVLGVQLVIAGVQLPSKYLQKEWKSLSILVGVVMAMMWLTTSVLVWAFMPQLPLLHALAIGACVTPTDPILSSAIVKGKFAEHNVPKKLQQIIVAESGANDGLGYPFLFLALYLIKYTGDEANPADGGSLTAMGLWLGDTWGYTILLSVAYGAAAGWAAKDLLHWAEKRDYIDKESFVVFAIALALFVLGTCGMIGSDDVLACFVAGNAFTWDDWFRLQTENDSFHPTIDMLLNMTIFMWFGAVCPWNDFLNNNVISIYQLVPLGILVLLVRRLPWVFAAHKYIHQISDTRKALFAGFFGPIGVSAVFYVYILAEFIDKYLVDGDEVRADVKDLRETGLVVVWFLAVCSVVVHGLCIPVAKVGFFAHETVMGHIRSDSEGFIEALPHSQLSPDSANVQTPLLPKSYQSFQSIREERRGSSC
ncbi:Na/H antiporter [Ilyonectria destructans]|nr:Na/H antiporter [Ilyonectria destructans]